MGKITAKIAETFGFAQMAQQAKSASDYDALADAMRAELQDVEASLANLDKQRETLLISGGNEHEFYDRISKSHEREKTLRANLRAVERLRDERRAIERTESIETAAREARERDVPALQQRLRGLLDKAQSLVEEARGVDELQQAIAAHDQNAIGNGRRDLVIDVMTVRERLARELADFTPSEPAPQMPGEPDQAYALRAQNHTSSEIDRMAQQNPFLLAAAAIKDVALKILVPRDAHTAARNGVEVNVMSFVDADGHPVKKVRNLGQTGRIGAQPAQWTVPETSPAEYSRDYVEPTVGLDRDRTSLRGF